MPLSSGRPTVAVRLPNLAVRPSWRAGAGTGCFPCGKVGELLSVRSELAGAAPS